MVQVQDFYFPSSNGVNRVHARSWMPENGAPRGVVQIVHGIVEHIGRYDAFARFLAEHGFLVTGDDHLGHGLSVADESGYGYFSDQGGWGHIVADLKTLHDRTAAEHPGIPYFLLGHSMGSFLTRTYLINCPQGLTGALITGTGQQPGALVSAGLALIAVERRLHREGLHYRSKLVDNICFGAYNKKFAPNRTSCDWVCSDEKVVDDKLADPASSFVPTLGAFREMLHGIRYIQKPANLARMDKALPVFFFSGDQDPVGDMGKGAKKAYQSFLDAGCGDVSLKLYPGGRHEMLNEINRDEVWDDVLQWLESKMGTL